jgi:hypothetical protein
MVFTAVSTVLLRMGAATTSLLLGHLFLLNALKKTGCLVEMEPQWTKNISSEIVCNFFYFFFVLYAVMAIFALVSFISMFFFELPKGVLFVTAVQGVLTLGIAITSTLFHYLVCDRALLGRRN